MPYFADKPFISGVLERAKSLNKRIVLPEADDDRVLHAAVSCTRDKIAQITLVGDRGKVLAAAERMHIVANGINVVNPETDEKFELYRD